VLFKKWREIYSTQELEKLYKVKNLLDENKIIYKTKTININLRLSMNNLNGRCVALNRTGQVRDFYRILVLEKDKERALYVLSKNQHI